MGLDEELDISMGLCEELDNIMVVSYLMRLECVPQRTGVWVLSV